MYDGFVAVCQVEVGEADEGWIAEGQALVELVAVEGLVVVVGHLLDDGQVFLFGLQYDESLSPFASGAPGHLGHHGVGVLVGPEVGLVEHGVGGDDAYYGDVVEVEALAYHLGADEYVGAAGGEVADDAFVGVAGAGGVEVHACDACLGEGVAHLFFYLLGAVAVGAQVGAAAAGALGGHLVCGAAVVAGELLHLSVQGELDVAVLTGGHPAALVALYLWGEASAVLEDDGLLSVVECLAHACE